MKQKILHSPRGDVYYWIQGEGDIYIVFTHGATMDHQMFQSQVEFFSKSYTTIVWDVPAHGKSKPYKNFSLQNSADDLIGILEQENTTKAHLVGQSMGGYISQIVALNHPNQVSSLVAVDSSPIQPSYYSRLDNWLLSITPTLLMLYPYNYLIKTIAKGIAVKTHAEKYALETLKKLTKKEIAHIMKEVYKGLQEYKEDFLLSVPTLIIHGELDQAGKVQEYSQQWSKKEKLELRIITNASHNSNMDNPEEFNRILNEFLEKKK